MDARKIQDNYKARQAWVQRFAESLPTIAVMGEVLGAPDPHEVAIGGVYWRMQASGRGGHRDSYISIGFRQCPDEDRQAYQRDPSLMYGEFLMFRVVSPQGAVLMDEKLIDPTHLQSTTHRFFEKLKEAMKA